ncbi:MULTISPECIES: OsmC family protein [Olivibacter]|uniref:OsmC family protein n=1 Tax=Olivibacter jilunii TaxID=985016 RepID=A0ABW6B1D3_9SPHI|nr:OsmC family protein [Olivibacter sp. UJ_SKK_5.1]
MQKTHQYRLQTEWTGNLGKGTANYSAYDRSYKIAVNQKVVIEGSSDPAFRGDRTKYNPEELLLASLSSCHMLWYLHLCAEAKITVLAYTDDATASMIETNEGGGAFSEAHLHPSVIIAEEDMIKTAIALHKKANELCFIANSVNFKVHHHPTCSVKQG